MGVNGYVGRILFVILVAVAFSYRQQIMETVNRTLGRTSGSSSSSSSSKDKTPSQEQPRTIPIRPPNPDYYNPPFDPSSPPEPLFSKSGVRMITANELQAHGHSGELTPIWLAVMGKVFDVQKGAEHYYGPNGGYKFFTGIDGSKAFVTGEFNEDGLIDDVADLSPIQLGEIEDWVKFYEKDYTFVGKLIGRYYTKDGNPTKEWYSYQKQLGEKDKIKAEQKVLQKRYPACNSHWSESTKGRVYCTEKSGGTSRDWVGYPRRFFAPGTTQWRCACINDDDLNSPHIRLYPDCDPGSHECHVDPVKMKALRASGQ